MVLVSLWLSREIIKRMKYSASLFIVFSQQPLFFSPKDMNKNYVSHGNTAAVSHGLGEASSERDHLNMSVF